MSAPWWVKSARPTPVAAAKWRIGVGATSGVQPVLLQANRKSVMDEVNARIDAYTPEWTARTSDDAGVALLTLFGGLVEPVLTRLNRLPEKAFIESLRLLGVEPLPAEPASAVLQFSIQNTAPGPILIPQGFQVGARSATGAGNLVILETQADLYATAAQIAQVQVQNDGFFLDVTPGPGASLPFAPFGADAKAGSALLIGLKPPTPQNQLAIGINVVTASGAPAPVAAGGVMPLPNAPIPALVWEVYDGGSGSFQTAAVLSDTTVLLSQSGIVTLGVPAVWGAGALPGMVAPAGLFWLRLRIVQGQFSSPPQVSDVLLNVVPALAVQTVVEEIVDFSSDPTRRHATLKRTPVKEGSLIVSVLDDPLSASDETDWQETQDLTQARPTDKVYEFDAADGEITFGDGVTGAAVPPGFRNVVATYQAISPSSGILTAGAANTLINSAPFVTGVNNPNDGSGGTIIGTQADAIRSGPQAYRARDRAVTTADFALLATQAGGVVRAHAIAGRHPAFPGKPIPGVVGVYVIPPDTNAIPGKGVAPMPTAATLAAVANSLSTTAALAGIDVVVAAPTYHYVQAQVAAVVDPSAGIAQVYQHVLAALTNYLHPITGGSDGSGWAFGAPLLYTPLVLFLMSQVNGLRAIPFITLTIDGQRLPRCADYLIGEDSLFWSLEHQIVPDGARGGS